jgi:hypothetical protein
VSLGGGKAGVFEAGNIREWRGHDVVDAEGHKIGELEAVYVDEALPQRGRPGIGPTWRSGRPRVAVAGRGVA